MILLFNQILKQQKLIKIMKKSVILLLINLWIPTVCFSQNIYKYPKVINDSLVVITHNQLKATNLIFVEHAKLAILYPIQERKIAVYKQLESEYKLNDSIKSKQIIEHQNTINENIKTINSLNSTISNKNKKIKRIRNWAIGSTIINIGLITLGILL